MLLRCRVRKPSLANIHALGRLGYLRPGDHLIMLIMTRGGAPASAAAGMPLMTSSGPQQGAGPAAHPVTITIDAGPPGPVIPADFAGLSFERGPLTAGNAGVSGDMFSPDNHSLVTLFRNVGLGNLRIGGGTVDQLIPAGTGSDGFAGIDGLFAFAAAAGVKVVYSLRLLSPAAQPAGDLKTLHAQAAGHIWSRYRDNCVQLRHRQRAGLACLPQLPGPSAGPGDL